MVEVVYRGVPGDWLFQYCFGRILAERWGVELRTPAIPDFPAAAGVAGQRYMAPFRCWSGLAVEDRQTSTLVRGAALEQPVAGRLMLYGWFHRWEWYRAHAAEIPKWLACAPPVHPAEPDDFAVVVRFNAPEAWRERTVYSGQPPAWNRAVPSVEAIQRLVERVQPARLVILTDAPQRLRASDFGPLETEVRGLGGFDTWNWLRSCRRMAIPAGHALDWWAAWLSGAEQIFVCDPWTVPKTDCPQEYG
jgi:hypothetical protein